MPPQGQVDSGGVMVVNMPVSPISTLQKPIVTFTSNSVHKTALPRPTARPPQDNCHFRSTKVTFNSSVKVHPVLHRCDMTSHEVHKVWMTRMERHQSKKESTNTVYLMRTGVGVHLTDQDFFCPRGLEHLWDHDSAESKQEAHRSQKIAIAMQRVLRRSGADSPHMIARAYRKYTLKSRKLAYQRGLRDQQGAVAATATAATAEKVKLPSADKGGQH